MTIARFKKTGYAYPNGAEITVQISPPQMPVTPDEWQNAVDAAEALLHLESARMYGLVKGGPGVNVERCEELLSAGRTRGIEPRPDCVERLASEWNLHPQKR